MLSGKLVHLIESHWEEILSSVISQIRRDPDTAAHYREHIESEMREWGRALLENLGHWLTSGKEDDIASRYEQLGKLRFRENIPLAKSLHVLYTLREQVLDFAEDHVYSKTTLELYEQEELDRRLSRFFDLLSIHLAKGYESAMQGERPAHAGAGGFM